MNESKKIELASLLLSEDKEIRILAINYIKSICKKNCAIRVLWDFDTDDRYKMLSIIASPNSPYSSDTIFSLFISIYKYPDSFSTQAILDLINLIIENNEIKNED